MTNTTEKASPAETSGLVRCPHCRSVILHSEIRCSGTFGGSAEVTARCLRCRKDVLFGYVDGWLTKPGGARPLPTITFAQLVAEDVQRARLQVSPQEMIVVSGEMLVTGMTETIAAARQVARRGTLDDCLAYIARLALLGASCQLVAEAILAEREGLY